MPLTLDIFSSICSIKKNFACVLPEHRRSYYISPRPGYKILNDFPNKVLAWKKRYFVVRNTMGWPFSTHWRPAIQDPDIKLDKETRAEVRSWAKIGMKLEDFLSKENLIKSGLSPPGAMEDIPTGELFRSMKKGKKRRASKKASSQETATPPAADAVVTEDPLVIDLVEEDRSKNSPPCLPEEIPTSELQAAHEASSSGESFEVLPSIMDPKCSLFKSKEAIYSAEVAQISELSIGELGHKVVAIAWW
ncbi:PREDICTED: uncharacterized protein LOC104601945 isoform X2 [Nelumbo nucifera]|uniref:Uncharacterized protein LOC104601945 isoform X2 n=1 Tax=Nelumbo nucifera TaxID=4432 RepID=A0A1U8AMT2_NELNU|nr:PREDICTED: uncharacterized protein LOC104601945 isoform X2 [Nelumbo nucifera]